MTEKNDLALKARTEEEKKQAKLLKEQFLPKNIVSVSETHKLIATPLGDKTKILETIKYKNGVTKRRLVEVVKPKNKRKSEPRTIESIKESLKKGK